MTQHLDWFDRMKAKPWRKHAVNWIAARQAGHVPMASQPAPTVQPVSAESLALPAARPAATTSATPVAATAAERPSRLRTAVKKKTVLTRIERFDLGQQQRREREEAIAAQAAAQAAAAARPAAAAPSAAPTFTVVDMAMAKQHERDRIRSILEAPEAVGREPHARSFAFATGLDVGHVRCALAKIHVETEEEQIDAAVNQILQMQRRRPAEEDEADQRARRIATAGGRQLSEATS